MARFKNCIKPLGLELERKVTFDNAEFTLRRMTPFERQKIISKMQPDILRTKEGVRILSSEINEFEVKVETVAICLGCFEKLHTEGWSFDEKVSISNLREIIKYNPMVLNVLYNSIDEMEKDYKEHKESYLGN